MNQNETQSPLIERNYAATEDQQQSFAELNIDQNTSNTRRDQFNNETKEDSNGSSLNGTLTSSQNSSCGIEESIILMELYQKQLHKTSNIQQEQIQNDIQNAQKQSVTNNNDGKVREHFLFDPQELANQIPLKRSSFSQQAFHKVVQQDKLCETLISEYVSEDTNSQKFISSMLFQEPNQLRSQQQEKVNLLNILSRKDELVNLDSNLISQTNEQSVLSLLREQELEKPVYLTVMVVGAQGLGKSSFIDAFLYKKFNRETTSQEPIRQTTQVINENKGIRKENKTILHLNMIDTPGYPQFGEIDSWMNQIITFVTLKFKKFDQYEDLEDQCLKDRKSVQQEDDKDFRIHSCLFFLSGPRILDKDLQIIHRLQEYLNIIPILARGDCYTPEEIKAIKSQLLKDADVHNIQWFDCANSLKMQPQHLERMKNGPLGPAPPFLMISSVQKMNINGGIHQQFSRQYPWGVCNIEDPEHSDFQLLYQLLIGFFISDLRCLTEYNYRKFLREKKKKAKQAKSAERKFKKQQNFYQTTLLTALGIGAIFGLFQMKRSNELTRVL